MVCGLSISVVTACHASVDGQQQAAPAKLLLEPASFRVVGENTLSAEANLPVDVDECVCMTTVGEVYGPADSVYLASWGKQNTCQNFTDDDTQTSYVLSCGDVAAGDKCVLEVLLHQAEDPGDAHSRCSCTDYQPKHGLLRSQRIHTVVC